MIKEELLTPLGEYNTVGQEDFELDTSWIDQENAIVKEPMKAVTCFFIYINTDEQIQHVTKEKMDLEEEPGDIRCITRSKLLQIIQCKKSRGTVKYRLMDIMLYNVELENGHLEQSYAGFLKNVTMMNEIRVHPSLCIFHEINCLYFVFQEIPRYDDDDDEMAPAKPILKMGPDIVVNPRVKRTKKVTFKEVELRHTRRRPTTR